jgi:hypothetical protein
MFSRHSVYNGTSVAMEFLYSPGMGAFLCSPSSYLEAHGTVVGGGTMLQAGRSRI